MAIDHFGELLVRPQALPLQTLPPVLEEAAGPALALVAPDEPNDACERITKHTEQWFLRTEARKPVRVQQTRSLRRSRHPKIMPDFEGPTKSRKPSNSAASRQVVPLKSPTRFREDPEFRKQGVASLLCRTVEERARQLGLRRLYLFTLDQQALYSHLGWRSIERSFWRAHPVDIMTKELYAG